MLIKNSVLNYFHSCWSVTLLINGPGSIQRTLLLFVQGPGKKTENSLKDKIDFITDIKKRNGENFYKSYGVIWMLKEKEIVGTNLIFLTNILVITFGFSVLIDQYFFQRCLFTKN